MPLTPRHREVLIMYASGMRASEIAADLHLSTRTIENHIGEIHQRLQTRSIAQSLVVAICRGELQLDVASEAVVLVVARELAAV